jgi:hypothetical protein
LDKWHESKEYKLYRMVKAWVTAITNPILKMMTG